jgi:hypothetical protein
MRATVSRLGAANDRPPLSRESYHRNMPLRKIARRLPIKNIARIVDAAMKDADLARKTAHDPEFRRGVTTNRRAALSSFTTVKHALKDRERLERQRSAERKPASASRSTTPRSRTSAPTRRSTAKKKAR